MDWGAMILAAITLLGGATGSQIISRLLGRKDGQAARAQAEFDRMTTERNLAATARDREASARRRLEESLSAHRRIIIEADCLTENDLPSWPV